MFLHENIDLFKCYINDASSQYGIADCFIEKDYYVFMMLKYIVSQLGENVVFKGGTSLSKAHRIITRFSEDIDLCLPQDKIKSDGARKRLVEAIFRGFNTLGLQNTTSREIQRRGDYNNLEGTYSVLATENNVKPTIKVEVAHRIKEFPYQYCQISSYLGDYLLRLYGSYGNCGIEPFIVLTVSVYRTFIDKLFAIGDYYLSGKSKRYSRHLYDVYKITNVINWSDIALIYDLKYLMESVRAERQSYRNCRSAQAGVSLKGVLHNAMVLDFYKEDYVSNTSIILFETVPYELCKSTILKLLDTSLFD